MVNKTIEIPTKEQIEEAAKAICTVWGYEWDGDPEFDDQVVPENDGDLEERPTKALFRRAAKAVLLLDKDIKIPTEQQVTTGVQVANDWVIENYQIMINDYLDYPHPEMIRAILKSFLK